MKEYFPEPSPRILASVGLYASERGDDFGLAHYCLLRAHEADPNIRLNGGGIAIWAAYSSLRVGDYANALRMADLVTDDIPKVTPPMSKQAIKQEAMEGINNLAAGLKSTG